MADYRTGRVPRDQIRAGAYALAALTSRAEASKFLKELADRIDNEDWERS